MCSACERSSGGKFLFEFSYPGDKPSLSGNYVGGFKSGHDIASLCWELYHSPGKSFSVEQLERLFCKKSGIEGRLNPIERHGPYHASGQKWTLEYSGSGSKQEVRMILAKEI